MCSFDETGDSTELTMIYSSTSTSTSRPSWSKSQPQSESDEQNLLFPSHVSLSSSSPSYDKASYTSHIKSLLNLALPISAAEILNLAMTMTDFAMSSHLGVTQMGTAALATTYWNLLLWPIVGSMTACDTLFSNAIGRDDTRAIKNNLIISNLTLLIASIPTSFLLFYSETALLLFKQDPELAKLTKQFCMRLLPGFYPFLLFLLLTKYLQNLDILTPCVVIAAISNILNVICNYVLIYTFDLGIGGAPISSTMLRFLQVAMMLCYIIHERKTNPMVDASFPKSFTECITLDTKQISLVKPYIKLALPGMLMLMLEAWFFDISIILVGLLNDVVLIDAHSAMLNICSFVFLSVPFSVALSGTIYIGKLIGMNRATDARNASVCTICITCVFQIFIAICFIIFRHQISYIFNSQSDVNAVVARLAIVAAGFQVFDGIQGAIGGILRAMGKQHIALLLNLVGFWMIGMSLDIVLTFDLGGYGADLGVIGLWWGVGIGVGTTAVAGCAYIWFKVDFEAECAKVQEVEGGGEGERKEENEEKGEREEIVVYSEEEFAT